MDINRYKMTSMESNAGSEFGIAYREKNKKRAVKLLEDCDEFVVLALKSGESEKMMGLSTVSRDKTFYFAKCLADCLMAITRRVE